MKDERGRNSKLSKRVVRFFNSRLIRKMANFIVIHCIPSGDSVSAQNKTLDGKRLKVQKHIFFFNKT